MKTGAVFVILNGSLKAKKLAYILKDSGATALIAHVRKRSVVEEALCSEMRANTRLLFAPLKLMPDAFPLLRMALSSIMRSYPAEGWDFAYLENSEDRIAFNAARCFYLNTLAQYGAPELMTG